MVFYGNMIGCWWYCVVGRNSDIVMLLPMKWQCLVIYDVDLVEKREKSLLSYLFSGSRVVLKDKTIMHVSGRQSSIVLKKEVKFEALQTKIMEKLLRFVIPVDTWWFTLPYALDTILLLDRDDVVEAMLTGSHAYVCVLGGRSCVRQGFTA